MNDKETARWRELNILLNRATLKIRDKRQVRNARELACELLERAWVEMCLRDFYQSMNRPDMVEHWSRYMQWDVEDAQVLLKFYPAA